MLLQTIQVVQMFAAYNMLVVVFSIGTLLKAMPVFQNFVIRTFDAVTRTKLPVGSYWDTLFTRKMFENVWHSVVLDLKKKVHHGCRAINPPVVSQDGRQCFPLLHMAKTGRPLVLNFGSCTCPIFMSKLSEFQQMVQEYCHIADFCVVYIEEAHPLDGWALNNNFAIRSHRSQTERCLAASLLAQKLSACPVVVDTMLDAANIGYGALPIRLHVVKENTLVYEGGAGPMGYNMDEVRDWLKQYSSITS